MIPWHLELLCPQEQWGHLSCLARPMEESSVFELPKELEISIPIPTMWIVIVCPSSSTCPLHSTGPSLLLQWQTEKSSKWMLLVIHSSLPAKILKTTWTSKAFSLTLIHTQFNVSMVSLWELGDLVFKTNSAILCNAFLRSLIISSCKDFLWVLAVRSN